jgi:transporter family protein
MPLIVLIVLEIVVYSLFATFASRASGKIDPSAGSAIFNGVGAVIPLLIYAYLRATGRSGPVVSTPSGLVYSLLAGVAVAALSVLFITIFQRGGLAYVTPLVYGGTVVLSSLIGVVLFGERVSLLQGAGIAVAAGGLVMIAIARA